MSKKRIFVCGFSQESNSFNPVLANFDDFSAFGISQNDETATKGTSLPSANGMFGVLKDYGAEVICGTIMRAGSGGPVDDKVVKWFVDNTLESIKKAGKLDGVLVSMHGATMSDKSDDVCGDIIEAIRKEVGEDMTEEFKKMFGENCIADIMIALYNEVQADQT